MPKTITAASILAQLGISTNTGCFDFTAVRNELVSPKVNVLSWSWPDNMKAGLMGGAPNFQHLTIQRSTVASNSPTSGVMYTVLTNFPVPDPNWTDIKQWSFTQWNLEGNPDTYTDTWNIQTPVCYRLILNCSNAGTRIEMDWIPTLVIPQQSFCIQDPNNVGNCYPVGANIPQGQRTLIWTTPDPSWWPSPGTACP